MKYVRKFDIDLHLLSQCRDSVFTKTESIQREFLLLVCTWQVHSSIFRNTQPWRTMAPQNTKQKKFQKLKLTHFHKGVG